MRSKITRGTSKYILGDAITLAFFAGVLAMMGLVLAVVNIETMFPFIYLKYASLTSFTAAIIVGVKSIKLAQKFYR